MPHDDTRHPRKGVADGVVGLAGSPVRWRPVSYQMEGIWAARWVSLASKGAPEAVSSPDTTQLLEPMPAAGPADRPLALALITGWCRESLRPPAPPCWPTTPTWPPRCPPFGMRPAST